MGGGRQYVGSLGIASTTLILLMLGISSAALACSDVTGLGGPPIPCPAQPRITYSYTPRTVTTYTTYQSAPNYGAAIGEAGVALQAAPGAIDAASGILGGLVGGALGVVGGVAAVGTNALNSGAGAVSRIGSGLPKIDASANAAGNGPKQDVPDCLKKSRMWQRTKTGGNDFGFVNACEEPVNFSYNSCDDERYEGLKVIYGCKDHEKYVRTPGPTDYVDFSYGHPVLLSVCNGWGQCYMAGSGERPPPQTASAAPGGGAHPQQPSQDAAPAVDPVDAILNGAFSFVLPPPK